MKSLNRISIAELNSITGKYYVIYFYTSKKSMEENNLQYIIKSNYRSRYLGCCIKEVERLIKDKQVPCGCRCIAIEEYDNDSYDFTDFKKIYSVEPESWKHSKETVYCC